MGGCQNYDPFLGTLNIRCRIIIGTQKGTIILTPPHGCTVELGFASILGGQGWRNRSGFLRDNGADQGL